MNWQNSILYSIWLMSVAEGSSRIKVIRYNDRKATISANDSDTTIVDKLLSDYNKHNPPREDLPTELSLGIYVNSFYAISEQTMDYSVSMYLRQQWRDERLDFSSVVDGDKARIIRLVGNRWQRIWVPDTFLRNEKQASFHEITVENRLLRLNSSGHLWYVTKISATLSCMMNLIKYPMDTQTCPMMFESFGYNMDVLYFSWLEAPVQVADNVQLPQFSIRDKILRDCSQTYIAGSFSCLEIKFVFTREIGFFLIQVYIPSMLIVILSWVSFWINVESSPARVSLGLLTVLTISTQNSAASNSLPRVSYVKGIDVWLSVCLVFVFSSLIEYAIVNVTSRLQNKPTRARKRWSHSLGQHRRDYGGTVQQVLNTSPMKTRVALIKPLDSASLRSEGTTIKASRIDKVSRQVFPLGFIIFNVVYWIVYSVPWPATDDEDNS